MTTDVQALTEARAALPTPAQIAAMTTPDELMLVIRLSDTIEIAAKKPLEEPLVEVQRAQQSRLLAERRAGELIPIWREQGVLLKPARPPKTGPAANGKEQPQKTAKVFGSRKVAARCAAFAQIQPGIFEATIAIAHQEGRDAERALMRLAMWSFWWEFNKEPYLNLKAKVRTGGTGTGTDGIFQGHGAMAEGKDSLAPSEEQIRQKIVPALLAALEKETNNDIVTGRMIAIARIGDASSETGDSQFEGVIKKFLSDNNQEVSETAAVALGILANPKSIPPLDSLLKDTPEARKLVGQSEVSFRTRSFAAYGLGLIGCKVASEDDRKTIVKLQREND